MIGMANDEALNKISVSKTLAIIIAALIAAIALAAMHDYCFLYLVAPDMIIMLRATDHLLTVIRLSPSLLFALAHYAAAIAFYRIIIEQRYKDIYFMSLVVICLLIIVYFDYQIYWILRSGDASAISGPDHTGTGGPDIRNISITIAIVSTFIFPMWVLYMWAREEGFMMTITIVLLSVAAISYFAYSGLSQAKSLQSSKIDSYLLYSGEVGEKDEVILLK
jgi:hypothetical protein